ncbi:GNAT family N-acetyltransferase [Embleya sp. AB8]|uniref:GNAT family N-acetyltransferase n=1 Tax=Embleya sp. AB8 TaxID=3156304 RepID=UPI003C760A2C
MAEHAPEAVVRIEPWSADDLPLLQRMNAPDMTEYLGGPESEEQVAARHRRYLAMGDGATGRMYRVVSSATDTPVGGIGFWAKEWQGEAVYETGWGILPEHQGHGLAAAAARAVVEAARAEGGSRWLHAYPKVEHPASNAVCRRAGFTLRGTCDFEYPTGHPIVCNDWRIELRGTGVG